MATTPAAFCNHDHHACASQVLARADARARAEGLRLTAVRRRVLEILASGHRALGAYEVLDQLALDGGKRQPPVAYRALDYLVKHGFAHRIQALNAFAACTEATPDHIPAFFICDTCQSVAETPVRAVGQAMEDAAGRIGFAMEAMNLEAVGQCPACEGAQ